MAESDRLNFIIGDRDSDVAWKAKPPYFFPSPKSEHKALARFCKTGPRSHIHPVFRDGVGIDKQDVDVWFDREWR